MIIFFNWLYSSHYFEFIACKEAYGDAASIANMCGDPGRGLLAIFDFVVVGGLWFVLSPVSAYVLRNRRNRFNLAPENS